MNEKLLSQKLSEVVKTLAVIIRRLKKIGTESDMDRVQNWLNILDQQPSTDDLNKLWNEVQGIGSHMNYMDYADDEFKGMSDSLKGQILDVIIMLRTRE